MNTPGGAGDPGRPRCHRDRAAGPESSATDEVRRRLVGDAARPGSDPGGPCGGRGPGWPATGAAVAGGGGRVVDCGGVWVGAVVGGGDLGPRPGANTDRYVATVSPLARDPAIQQAIADQITAQIFRYLDVQ